MGSPLCRFTFVVLLTTLFFYSNFAGQKLKYKFEKGKNYKYSSIAESKIIAQAMGQEFTITSTTFFDYSITSTEYKNGVYNLIITFDKFDIKLNMPMMGFSDSVISMSDYIGKRLKMSVTELGKTLSIETIDTIKPSRIQAMANINPTDLFKNLLLQLPEKELDINSAWKIDQPDTTRRGGSVVIAKQNIEMKIVGVEKQFDLNCWKITMNGTNIIEGSGTQAGNDITIDGSSKISGNVHIAQKEGILTTLENVVEMDMTSTITGANTAASNMIITTTTKNKLVK